MGNYSMSYILRRQEYNKKRYLQNQKDYSGNTSKGVTISEVNPDSKAYFNVGAMKKKMIREKILNHSLDKWV